MRLDSVTREILFHVFQKEEMKISKLTNNELERLTIILEQLGYTIKTFSEIKEFSETEKGMIIFHFLKKGIEISKISQMIDWKKFELIISHIFNELSYTVLTNFRFKDEFTKYEIDVIAFKYPYVFLIDCKYYKLISSTNLKEAAEKQKDRTEILIEMFPIISDELVKNLTLPLKRQLLFFPIIISWRQPNLQIYQDVPIVPYNQLSGFLDEIDELRDSLFHLAIELD